MQKDDIKFGESNITFAGFPVTFGVRDNEVYVHVKGLIGLYSQIKAFTETKHAGTTCPYGYFRSEQLEQILIKRNGDSTFTIGCATDSVENGVKLYNECERLLGIPLTEFDADFYPIIK
jgi:hypothetical protein